MRIALYEPDIPQNTGTILRLVRLPRGRGPYHRAGRLPDLATAPSAAPAWTTSTRSTIARHASLGGVRGLAAGARACGWSCSPPRAATSYLDHAYRAGDILLFGRESAGVPDAVHEAADARLSIPMRPGLRSLNVAMAAAMALGEALRQTGGFRHE